MRLSAFHTTHNTLSIRILATDLHLSRLSCFSWQLFSAHLNNAFGKSNDFIFIFPYRCDSRVLSYMYEGLIIHVRRSYHTCIKVLSYMYEGLIIHVRRSSCKVFIIFVRFYWNCWVSTNIGKIGNIEFHENSSCGSRVLYAYIEGRTDRWAGRS